MQLGFFPSAARVGPFLSRILSFQCLSCTEGVLESWNSPITAKLVSDGKLLQYDDAEVDKRCGIPVREVHNSGVLAPSNLAADHGSRRYGYPISLRSFSAAGWGVDHRRTLHSGRNEGAGGLDLGEVEHKSKPQLGGKDYKTIRAEIVGAGSVGLIVLDRPQALNALSEALMNEVVDACQTFDSLDEVGAIVITGRDKAFAAGVDIKELKDISFVEAHKSRILSRWNSLSSTRKPMIAAVNGFCLGGGCEVAMACDILLAGEKAVFGQPEVNLGVIPGMGGTQRLIREVGKSRAMEMILTGKAFMKAEEAAQRGLVSRVIPGDYEALLAEAISLAETISQLSRPSVAMAKEAVNAAYEVGLQEGIRREHALFCAAFGLDDKREGMTAFVEKRKPMFKHK